MKIYRLRERLLLIFLATALGIAVFADASVPVLIFALIVYGAAIGCYLKNMKT